MSIKKYKLGDVCNIFSGNTPSKRNSLFWENGNINWLTSSELNFNISTSKSMINSKYANYCLSPKHSTLIALVGSTIGKIGFLKKEMAINQNIASISIKDEYKNILNEKYLFYLILTLKNKILSMSSGSAQSSLSTSDLKKIKIFVTNLEEQQQIIDIIEPFEKINEIYRKKRNQLFNIISLFKISNDSLELGDIAEISTGKRNANFSTKNGKYNFFTCSINKTFKCDSYSYDGEFLIVAGNGDVGDVKYFNGKFDAYQRTYLIKSNLLGNIYFSIIKNKEKLLSSSNGSVIKFLTINVIKKLKIDSSYKNNEIRIKILKYIHSIEKISSQSDKIINLLIEKYIK